MRLRDKEPASLGYSPLLIPSINDAGHKPMQKSPLPTHCPRGSGRDVLDANSVHNKTHRTLKGFTRWITRSSKG